MSLHKSKLHENTNSHFRGRRGLRQSSIDHDSISLASLRSPSGLHLFSVHGL